MLEIFFPKSLEPVQLTLEKSDLLGKDRVAAIASLASEARL